MTKKIYYEKIGRRYKAVYEYDQTLMNSFPKGSHLVICYPGGQSTRYNIDPAYAPLIAAGRVAEDKISEAIRKASDLRPKRAPITEGQIQAWENLVKEFGEDARMLTMPSAREVAEDAVKALTAESDKLLANPAVRLAYEQFQMVCKLTAEQGST
jgi:hypothetical protein